MALHPPLWMQNDQYQGVEDRQFIGWGVPGGSGVIRGTRNTAGYADLQVHHHSTGADMTVDVEPGYVFINGTTSPWQGSYFCWSDSVHNLGPFQASPGSGLSRIDLVVATVRDATVSGSNNDWIMQIVTGTPASTGSQNAPATPANSAALAQVLLSGSGASISDTMITDVRPRSWARNWARSSPFSNLFVSLNEHDVLPAPSSGSTRNDQQTGSMVIPSDGTYEVSIGNCIYSQNSSAIGGHVGLIYNGGNEVRRMRFPAFSTGTVAEVTASFSMELTKGDTLTLNYHNSDLNQKFAFGFNGAGYSPGTPSDNASWFEARSVWP